MFLNIRKKDQVFIQKMPQEDNLVINTNIEVKEEYEKLGIKFWPF
mgnify:CR=1 FL=1